MLIGDDDANELEDAEEYAILDDELLPPEPDAASDAVADDVGTAEDVRLEDFELLPYVAALVQAHREGGQQAAAEKMAALRRAVRCAEARMALLKASAEGSTDETGVGALLEAQSALINSVTAASSKRRAGWANR